jgi:hypothetical protein
MVNAPADSPTVGPPAHAPGAPATANRPAAGGGAAAPWEVPPEAYGTQTLYRVAVTGAEGQGSLKLTLRLAAAGRYQAQAVDPLGRALWSLDVEGGKGFWLDHRARLFCRLENAFDLAFLPLGPLTLDALPPLLLGRLPVAPADPALLQTVALQPAPGTPEGGGRRQADAEIAYGDAAGRRWTAVLRDGQPISWGLWQDPQAGPILSWLDSGGWAVLSDRRKGVQVRWRQTLREALRTPLTPPSSPPADYRPGQCDLRGVPAVVNPPADLRGVPAMVNPPAEPPSI